MSDNLVSEMYASDVSRLGYQVTKTGTDAITCKRRSIRNAAIIFWSVGYLLEVEPTCLDIHKS